MVLFMKLKMSFSFFFVYLWYKFIVDFDREWNKFFICFFEVVNGMIMIFLWLFGFFLWVIYFVFFNWLISVVIEFVLRFVFFFSFLVVIGFVLFKMLVDFKLVGNRLRVWVVVWWNRIVFVFNFWKSWMVVFFKLFLEFFVDNW